MCVFAFLLNKTLRKIADIGSHEGQWGKGRLGLVSFEGKE